MKRIVQIFVLWCSLLCAAVSGALTIGLIADRYLTDRSYDRTESMVKDTDEFQTPTLATQYYQHEQNVKRKEGITAILRLAVPIFGISGIVSLILLFGVMKTKMNEPNIERVRTSP